MLLNCKILLAKVKEIMDEQKKEVISFKVEMKYGNKHVHRNYNFFNTSKIFKVTSDMLFFIIQ